MVVKGRMGAFLSRNFGMCHVTRLRQTEYYRVKLGLIDPRLLDVYLLYPVE